MSGIVPGLVHLYVGDGKGKTTAAAGLAVRAAGCGKQVLFCQFLKGRSSHEVASLESLGVQIRRAKHTGKFTFQMTPQELEEAAAHHQSCLGEAAALMATGAVGLAVLDESVDAVNAGMFPAGALLEAVRNRHPSVEVVLTGRNPHPSLVELADYHTDFVCRKHPYQSGVPAREGVEY